MIDKQNLEFISILIVFALLLISQVVILAKAFKKGKKQQKNLNK